MSPTSIIVDQRNWEQTNQERASTQKRAKGSLSNDHSTAATKNIAALKEGAYFISHDNVIYRHFKDGDKPVLAPKHSPAYPQKIIADSGTKLERYNRLMLLTRMRDTIKTILHLQEEYSDEMIKNMPEAPWAKSQKHLKELYDSFTRNFGPINSYEWRKAGQLDENGQRSEYKIRTNLRKFRKDPDAYLVASIEEFDEDTQEAGYGAIFTQRVLRARSGHPTLDDAAQALGYCLDERTKFDLDFMQQLLPEKTAEQIIAELKEKQLIHFDKTKDEYVTSEEFLSGDIVKKLELADDEEKEALINAKPEELGPEEINISLGMPWIPKEIIAKFAEEELGLRDIKIEYVSGTHRWFINSYPFDYMQSQFEYGTEIVHAGILLERAMNNRDVSIRKKNDSSGTPIDPDSEKKLASDRMQKLKDRFTEWAWEDKERAEILQKIYNDRYNGTKPRQFDGSHISFAGSSVAIGLRDHQKNGVARDLNSPATLFEWDVGAGKTFGSIAALMEGRRHGKFKKPMLVVQNHLLGEFSRDFMKLYPNANILVVEEDQLVDHGESLTSQEKAQKLAQKTSEHDWDAIIITKSNFDRFHISPERKIKTLIDEIQGFKRESKDHTGEAYSHLIDKVQKLSNKLITHLHLINEADMEDASPDQKDWAWSEARKQIAQLIELPLTDSAWEEILEPLREKNAVSFEELGIDKLYVDEAHDYKNLTIKSRLSDVAKAGSTKADSFKEKVDYVREVNPDNYLTMLTATPVLNSLMEFFVFQQYLMPELLEERGIFDPDAWISMFGEVIEDIEMAPETGYYRPVKRLSSYKNFPEIASLYRSRVDVLTRGMLDMDLPELVNAEGEVTGKPQIIGVPENPQLTEFFATLIERAVKVREGMVAPDEDNILKIINEARLATLDPRLVGLDRDPEIKTKLDYSAEEIAKRYHATKGNIYYSDDEMTQECKLPGSLQMVLCNQGIPKGDGSFSTYEQLQKQLVSQGVPQEKIAFIHDHDSDKKKEELFKKCRSGEIAVLVGTTQKLGTGTNVQKRLVALHELDAPWRPGDVIQGRGRIDRQKNQNPFIEILTYIQEGSFDIYNWQMLERKARFIAQAKVGTSEREFNEDDEFTQFCEWAKNSAANDDMLVEKADIARELAPMRSSRTSRQNEKKRSKRRLKIVRDEIEDLKDYIQGLKKEKKNLALDKSLDKPFEIDGHSFRRSIRAGKQLKKHLRQARQTLRETLADNNKSRIETQIGSLFGVAMSLKADLEVVDKPVEKDGKTTTTRDYKYNFTVVINTPEPTIVPIPMEDVQESRLEKDFEKTGRNHEGLCALFGNTANVRAKRRELTKSFNKIIERIGKPFTDNEQSLEEATKRLEELQSEEKNLTHVVESKFKREGRYQYLMRRRRDIDKKLMERKQVSNDNLDPSSAMENLDVAIG